MLSATIELNYNYGFKWFEKNHVRAKGWVIDDSGKSYRNLELVDYFFNVKTLKDIKELLLRTTGHFAVILVFEDFLMAAADRGRSIPLYFRSDRGNIEISDSGFSLIGIQNEMEFNPYSFQEYLAAGHVTQNKTLFKNVSQLGAGEIGCFTKDNVEITSYFDFLPNQQFQESFELSVGRFVETLDFDYKNLINALSGRTVVIPVSGGYDSRSIASMFKRHGYQNVICYSFGQDNSPEMITSKRVAETLGFQWLFIETTPDAVKGFVESDDFLQYVEYAANASSFYIIQDFFAVKKMREENLVPNDSVFMPGHSGDTLGGSNFLELFSGQEDENEMIKKLIKHRYDVNSVSAKFLKSVQKDLESQYNDSFQPAIWFDYWCMKEWNPKMFANGVRLYEFFGYIYWLPLWGKNPLLFFANLPLEFRLQKELYEYTLETRIFEPLGVNFSPNRRFQYSHTISVLQRIKNIVKQILPKRFIYSNLTKDYINSKLYTREMYNNMKSKGVNIKYNGTNSVKVQWYIRYLETKRSLLNKQGK